MNLIKECSDLGKRADQLRREIQRRENGFRLLLIELEIFDRHSGENAICMSASLVKRIKEALVQAKEAT